MKVASELLANMYVKKVEGSQSDHIFLTRVYLKNTLIYTEEHGMDGAFPIHIDVFTLMYAKKDPSLIFKVKNSLTKYLSIVKLNDYEYGWLYEHFKNQPLKLAVLKSGEILKRKYTENQFEEMMNSLLATEEETDNYICLQDPGKHWPVKYFGSGRKARYNDMDFSIPKYAKVLLEKMYGAYLDFPPEKERFTSDMDRWIVKYDNDDQ